MIAIEAITALFAFFLAYLNEVPVQKMIRFGTVKKESETFHLANGLLKATYAVAVSFAYYSLQWKTLLGFFLLMVIQWLVFDISLNLLIGHEWDYEGTTAKTDKELNRHFKKPGLDKAIGCTIVIIILNLVIYGRYLK